MVWLLLGSLNVTIRRSTSRRKAPFAGFADQSKPARSTIASASE
jgi:hypothetical protein